VQDPRASRRHQRRRIAGKTGSGARAATISSRSALQLERADFLLELRPRPAAYLAYRGAGQCRGKEKRFALGRGSVAGAIGSENFGGRRWIEGMSLDCSRLAGTVRGSNEKDRAGRASVSAAEHRRLPLVPRPPGMLKFSEETRQAGGQSTFGGPFVRRWGPGSDTRAGAVLGRQAVLRRRVSSMVSATNVISAGRRACRPTGEGLFLPKSAGISTLWSDEPQGRSSLQPGRRLCAAAQTGQRGIPAGQRQTRPAVDGNVSGFAIAT